MTEPENPGLCLGSMYAYLRCVGHLWRHIESFLTSIGGMTIKTCHKWANILVNKDFDDFKIEERWKKR